MRDWKKVIHDDVNHLFYQFELDTIDIVKSVDPDREWDYVLKLRMGKVRYHFKEPCRFGGFCLNESLYKDCVKDKRVKNNWICWRDGILKEVQSSTPKVKT